MDDEPPSGWREEIEDGAGGWEANFARHPPSVNTAPPTDPLDTPHRTEEGMEYEDGVGGRSLGLEPTEYEMWRERYLAEGNACAFGPFGSAQEWEWVCWAIQSGVSLVKLDDLLRTQVVSPYLLGAFAER